MAHFDRRAYETGDTADSSLESNLDQLMEAFDKVIDDSKRDWDRRDVRALDRIDATSVPMVLDYASRSEQGGKWALLEADDMLSNLSYPLTFGNADKARTRLLHSTGRFFNNRITLGYAIGEVYEESGVAITENNFIPIRKDTNQLLRSIGLETKSVQHIGETACRGMAIARLGELEQDPTAEEGLRFADWAGNHPDSSLVARTVQQCQTLSIPVLRDIMEQGDANPALRNGVL